METGERGETRETRAADRRGADLGSAAPAPRAEADAQLRAIDARLDEIARIPFRARFHLRRREEEFVRTRGLETVREHARELLSTRLAPAHPANDGRQTPWGGHPVFVAQHATGTCCRTCLAKTHRIPAGHDLTPEELGYVVDVIARWVERDARASARRGPEASRSRRNPAPGERGARGGATGRSGDDQPPLFA